MINEILQWVALLVLATPSIVRIVQDFKEEEDE